MYVWTCLHTQCIFAAVGVSLKLLGATIPNNSLVDLDDILYRAPIPCCDVNPSNARPDLHDQALLCVTDLEDCCDAPRTVQGDWYYPNGTVVPLGEKGGRATFRSNRGPNEVIDGRQFYGSIRLFRRWGNPQEKGRYRCELPSAADPNVTLILYVNICKLHTISWLCYNTQTNNYFCTLTLIISGFWG